MWSTTEEGTMTEIAEAMMGIDMMGIDMMIAEAMTNIVKLMNRDQMSESC
jgi:hypothetical protein